MLRYNWSFPPLLLRWWKSGWWAARGWCASRDVKFNVQNDDEYRAVQYEQFVEWRSQVAAQAPERLGSEGTYNLLNRLPISLVVIDEVHVLAMGSRFSTAIWRLAGLLTIWNHATCNGVDGHRRQNVQGWLEEMFTFSTLFERVWYVTT